MKKKGTGIIEKFSLEQVRDFWGRQAVKYGQSQSASWSDHAVIEMEIREIVKYLSAGDRVLDVGCANGYSTVQFASGKRIDIQGIDFIPEMIRQSRARLKGLPNKLMGKVDFKVGDITALDRQKTVYDKVVAIRVLINLKGWNRQLRGLRECVRVLKTGGTLLLSEATLQGWKRLNKFRKEWGLADIPMPPFNQYIDQDKLIKAASSHLQLIKIVDFASTYYVGTRVLKPLLIKALGANINAADPDMEWNRLFAQLPSWGDYGTQKLFVFKKL